MNAMFGKYWGGILAVLLLSVGSAAPDEGTPKGPRAEVGVGRMKDGPTPDWPIKRKAKTKRVFYENYEDGTCKRIRADSSAVVVSAKDGADVIVGKYCLRGNFDPKTTDPITGKKGKTKGAGLGWIYFADAGVKDELYVSFLWRLDAGNSFQPERGGRGGDPAYKMVYITGSATPWAEKVNYVVIQRGDSCRWRIANNSPNGREAVAYGAGGQVGPDEARQGMWHRVEFFLKLESTPGARDGIAVIKVDGKVCIDKRDVPYLWKGAKQQSWGMIALPSMFGGAQGPRGSFGWQLDELEIWDGLPVPKRDEKRSAD